MAAAHSQPVPMVPKAVETHPTTALSLWRRFAPEIIISLLLFACSQAFVLAVATAERWTSRNYNGQISEFCRWDCKWYVTVAKDGYDKQPVENLPDATNGMANWGFFPLFPLSIRAVHSVVGHSYATSAVLVGRLEYLAAIFCFLLLIRQEASDISEKVLAGALVAFNPYLVYGQVGYTEPLYFAFACVSFLALAERRWKTAGILGGLLSATRMVGVLFAVSYVVEAIRKINWRTVRRERVVQLVLGLLLCPIGCALFALYLHHHMGDALAFSHIQVAFGRVARNPLAVLVQNLTAYEWWRVWAVMCIGALVVSAWLLRTRPELGIFLALNVVIALSSGNILAAARYIWWQPPVIYAIWRWLRKYPNVSALYLACTGAFAAIMILNWFSGLGFVI